MFSQNKNYLSKFLQLTGILSVFLLIFFSHNKVFGTGETIPLIKENILQIKNKDQQTTDIKAKAEALWQEISTFEKEIQQLFTTENIQNSKQLLDEIPFDSLLNEINTKLDKQDIPQTDKTILKDMQTFLKTIKDQKQDYSNDVLVLSKASEKTLEEVKKAFQNIIKQTDLLETNMQNLETKKNELTDANKLSDAKINNLKNKINSFLTKNHSSTLKFKETQLTKIETDYQKLKADETSKINGQQKVVKTTDKNSNEGSEPTNEKIKQQEVKTSKTDATTKKSTTKDDDKEKSINAFQIIIIGVFISIMVSAIIFLILQQIKKSQSKR